MEGTDYRDGEPFHFVLGGGFDQWKPSHKFLAERHMVNNILKVLNDRGPLSFLAIKESTLYNPVRLAHVLARMCHKGMVGGNILERSPTGRYYTSELSRKSPDHGTYFLLDIAPSISGWHSAAYTN